MAREVTMRLRQIAVVASKLEPVVEELTSAFALRVAYRDPGISVFGLENAVIPVGDAFLEVVSPVRDDTTAGRYLQSRGGDAGYMAIFQVPDLAAARGRAERLGIRVVWEGSAPGISGAHLHPKDIGGAIVSVDQADPPDGWPWAGPDWADHVNTEVVSGIVAVDVATPEPARLADRWSQLLAAMAVESTDGGWGIGLDQGLVRFCARDEEEGIIAVDLLAADRSRTGEARRIAGVDFRLV
jgi:hypothetical protein